MRILAPMLTTLALTAAPAWASDEDAWAVFRAEVKAACVAIAEGPGTIVVEVNPFGSQSFGAAIVTVTSEGVGTDRMICIYDQLAKVAELTVPF